MTLARAAVAVPSAVLTAVHGQVVSRAELGEAGIAAELVDNVLVIHFVSNLEEKKEYITRIERTCMLISEIASCPNLKEIQKKKKFAITTAFFWHMLHLVEMLLV